MYIYMNICIYIYLGAGAVSTDALETSIRDALQQYIRLYIYL